MADDKTTEGNTGNKANPDNGGAAGKGSEPNPNGSSQESKTVPHQAFHQERELRKEAEQKIKVLEDEKAAAEKADLEAQGKYQELHQKEKERAESLEAEKTVLLERVESLESSFKKNIETQLSGIKNEGDRELATQMLEPHSISKQQELLPTLLDRFGVKQNLNNKPSGGGKAEGSSAQEISDMETQMRTAEAKGDVDTVVALNRKIRKAKQGLT